MARKKDQPKDVFYFLKKDGDGYLLLKQVVFKDRKFSEFVSKEKDPNSSKLNKLRAKGLLK